MKGPFLIPILLLLGLTACGGPVSRLPSPQHRDLVQRSDNVLMESPSTGQSLACGEESCPTGIARLFNSGGGDGGQWSACTAFLVAPDILMTDSHCILGDADEFCRNTAAHFRQGGGDKTVAVPCGKVISVNAVDPIDQTTNTMDYAFIRLKSSVAKATPYALNVQDGVAHGRSYGVWVVDPDGRDKGTIRRRSCVGTQNSMVLPEFTDDVSPMVSLVDCPVDHGNSGSPVVDDKGDVVALVFSGTTQEESDQSELLQGRRVALALTPGCMSLPAGVASKGGKCAPKAPGTGLGTVTVEAQYAQKLKEVLERASSSMPAPDPAFRWEADGESPEWVLVPRCLEKDGEFRPKELFLPGLRLTSKVDAWLRPDPRVEILPGKPYRLELETVAEGQEWAYVLEALIEGEYYTGAIKLCPQGPGNTSSGK